jgi:hypothetical protein
VPSSGFVFGLSVGSLKPHELAESMLWPSVAIGPLQLVPLPPLGPTIVSRKTIDPPTTCRTAAVLAVLPAIVE